MSVGAFIAGALTVAVVNAAIDFATRKPIAKIEVNKDGHWCFPIGTWQQMLAIPAERRERFLAELPLSFRRMWEMIDQYPLTTLPGAVWVDDGLGELRPNVVNAPANSGDVFADRPLDPGAPA